MVVETAKDASSYVAGFNAASFSENIKYQCAWVTNKIQLRWLEILLRLTTSPEKRFTAERWKTMLLTLEPPFHHSEIREGTNIAGDVDASIPQVPVALSDQHSGSAPNDDTHVISNAKLEAPFHNSEIREGTNTAADTDASKPQTPGTLSHQLSGSVSHDDNHANSETKLENADTVALSEAERQRLQLVLGSIHTFVLNRGELELNPILSDVINDLYTVIWFRNQKHPGISALTEKFHAYLDLRLPVEARRLLKVQPTTPFFR